MPLFSVIIPAHNRGGPLRRAVESVLAQTFRDYELIVVDDGSTDDTPRIADEYGGRVIYIRQENGGVSSARNAGLRSSGAPLVAFLDSDDAWLPGKLLAQRDFFQERPGISLVQTDEQWIRSGRRVNPMRKHLKREGDIFADSLELCLVSPSAAAMKRDLFGRYGLFDEDLPVCEDYDLWLRVTSRERVGLIGEKLVLKYGGHADQLSRRFWGMDRFRVYAIMKLLEHGELTREQRLRARDAALRKAGVLLNGAVKRGKREWADRLRGLMECIGRDSCSSKDYSILLGG